VACGDLDVAQVDSGVEHSPLARLTPQRCDLMPQGEDLDVLVPTPSAAAAPW
jgi:hypothetical protein